MKFETWVVFGVDDAARSEKTEIEMREETVTIRREGWNGCGEESMTMGRVAFLCLFAEISEMFKGAFEEPDKEAAQ